MRKGLTELVFILDRSGSMAGLEKDTIGGFNGMITRQKEEAGEALVSTVLFNSDSRVIHDRLPLDQVPQMTSRDYYAGGCTALLDAIGGAIHHIGNVHKYIREEDRPEHTMFVITTDGLENASRSYTLESVRQAITRQQEKNGWEFLFLGANMDAVETATRMGMEADQAVTFTNDEEGVELNFKVLSDTVAHFRTFGERQGDWQGRIRKNHGSRS